MTRKIYGTVIIQASKKRSRLTSSAVLLVSLIKYPGNEAPNVTESKLNNIPVKDTIFTWLDLNQFKASLLGVLRMNMLPIAANAEPIKQKTEFPSWSKSLNHTPATVKMDPAIKLTLMPFLLMSQLQGNAKSGCAIVNINAFIVTYMELTSNIFSTATLMLEKVWTGIEFTKAANRYVVSTTKRYLSCGY